MGDAHTLICVVDVQDDELVRTLERRLSRTGVEVVVESRLRERRASPDRRRSARPDGRPLTDERRLIHSVNGRRVGEQRARLEVVSAEKLPERLVRHSHTEGVAFMRRIAPGRQQLADLEDLRLIMRLQAGDKSAFGPVYERHLRRIHSYAEAALGDSAEAEDITQEVFLKMLEAMPGYEVTGTPFRIWLFRVLRNLVIDRLRARQRFVVEPPELIEERLDERSLANGEAAANGLSIVEGLSGDAGERAILQAAAELPIAQRQVLVLRFLLDLNTVEIAEALGATPNAVANRQHRAIRALRARFERDGEVSPGRPRLAMLCLGRPSPVLRARQYLPC